MSRYTKTGRLTTGVNNLNRPKLTAEELLKQVMDRIEAAKDAGRKSLEEPWQFTATDAITGVEKNWPYLTSDIPWMTTLIRSKGYSVRNQPDEAGYVTSTIHWN